VSWNWRLASALASLAVMLVLITTNVRLATNSISLYAFLFERHNVSERTGISPDGLRTVGTQVQAYFSTEVGPLYVEAEVYGLRRPLFSEAEVAHMADVKGLFHLTWRVQGASGLFLLLMVIAAAVRFRGGAWYVLATWTRNGAALTAATVAAVGAVSAVAFGPLFTLFHRLGFRNDLWLLDPRTDLLVQFFPFGFWRDVTLLIGLAAVVEAGLLFFAAHVVLRRLHRPAGEQTTSVRLS